MVKKEKGIIFKRGNPSPQERCTIIYKIFSVYLIKSHEFSPNVHQIPIFILVPPTPRGFVLNQKLKKNTHRKGINYNCVFLAHFLLNPTFLCKISPIERCEALDVRTVSFFSGCKPNCWVHSRECICDLVMWYTVTQ